MFANIGSFSLHDSSEESGVSPSFFLEGSKHKASSNPHHTPQKVNSPHLELSLQNSDITPKDQPWHLERGDILRPQNSPEEASLTQGKERRGWRYS